MGIGAGHYLFDLPARMKREFVDTPISLESTVPFHGLMAQGPFWLVADDHSVAGLVELLSHGDAIVCDEPASGIALVVPGERLVLTGVQSAPAWMTSIASNGGAELRPITSRDCKAPTGPSGTLISSSPESNELPKWSLEEFEFRLGINLGLKNGEQTQSATLVGVPNNEGARRFHQLEQLLKESPNALFVDSGSFVDGNSSVRNDALSLHRPIGFSMLRRLSPAALVPGQTELAGGPSQFLSEARRDQLPYVATNWSTERGDLALPSVLEKTVQTSSGLLTVAFLGVVDPQLHEQVHQLSGEGVTLTEPVEAVQQTVARLRARGAPPNAIIVLTSASSEVVNQLRTQTRFVDLVLGDTNTSTLRLEQGSLTFLDTNGTPTPPSAVLPLQGITTADLFFGGAPAKRVLTQVVHTPQRIPERMKPDDQVMREITRTRASEYPMLDKALLPAPPGAPTTAIDDTLWRRIVCEAVRDETQADVVLLAALPPVAPIPGPQTELLTVNRLAVRDRLEVHWIPGDRMNWLLLKAIDEIDIACGATLGNKVAKTRGRIVEAERIYRVVTTDRARQTTGLGPLLKGAYSPFILDQPGYRVLHDDNDSPLTLRAATLSALRRLRDEAKGEPKFLSDLVARSPNDRPKMWLARLRHIALKLESFRGAENDAYSAVPETLATSPSSLTIGTDLDVAMDYSSKALLFDFRLRSSYTRLQIRNEDPQESSDDLRLSSSASLPGVLVPIGKKFLLMPYSEILLDSEITPVENDDGSLVPRQADLSLTLGLSARRFGVLRRLRLGLLTLRDLSQIQKSNEWGARLEGEVRMDFGPRLSWITTFDSSIYGNTPEQDESDLRFRTLLNSRLSLPLARYLAVAVYGQGFIFQGRVASTSDVEASFTAGLAIDIAGAFEL